MKILLASKSPRRREILKTFTDDFEVVKTDVDESFNENFDVVTNIMALSKKKAASLDLDDEEIAISADTSVIIGDKILGKAGSREEAFDQLKSLSGKTHQVITAFTLRSKTKMVVDYVSTEVVFKDFSDDEINAYLDTGEWEDKAGSYAIQGKGTALVDQIHGDFLNVVGLPISKIYDYLKLYFDLDLLRR